MAPLKIQSTLASKANAIRQFFSCSRKADALNTPSNTIVLPHGGTLFPSKGDRLSLEVWQRFLLYKTEVALALHKSPCLLI